MIIYDNGVQLEVNNERPCQKTGNFSEGYF